MTQNIQNKSTRKLEIEAVKDRVAAIRFLVILFLLSHSIILASTADLDADSIVDINDLTILGDYWLGNPVTDPNSDLNANGYVNMADFAILSSHWMLGHVNERPTAEAVNTSSIASVPNSITLNGNDAEDNNGCPVVEIGDGNENRRLVADYNRINKERWSLLSIDYDSSGLMIMVDGVVSLDPTAFIGSLANTSECLIGKGGYAPPSLD